MINMPNNNILSYEDFLKIQEQNPIDKIEYFNGLIVCMSPSSIKHNEITTNITFELKKFFKGSKCKVYSEQVSILFENETDKKEFLPDVFVMCDNAKTKGNKFIEPPKVIFEVVSKKYAANDYFIKAQIYESFGVLEYNIVEQNGNIVQYVLEENKFVINNTYHLGDIYNSHVFEELKFDLTDIFE